MGLFGASQGGWIALLAASRDSAISFLVTLSGPTITPAEQGHYIVEAALRKKGHAAADIEEALQLDRQIVQVYRTDSGWEEGRLAVEAARSKRWFADAGIGIQPRDSWNWSWYRDLPFDFDPVPLLRTLTVPWFAADGALDALVPTRRSQEMIDVLRQSGKPFQSVVFPGVGHILYTENGAPSRSWKAPAEYWTRLGAWFEQESIIR
jgi:pimeloyl-ACP methyl ester carboxylesterase